MTVLITWKLIFKIIVTVIACLNGIAISTSLCIDKRFKKLGIFGYIVLVLTIGGIWI